MIENKLIAPQGWQCPVCKRVYSPLTPMCFYCGQETETNTTTSDSLDCWSCNPELRLSNPPKNIWTCKYCGAELILDVTMMPSKPCNCLTTVDAKSEQI